MSKHRDTFYGDDSREERKRPSHKIGFLDRVRKELDAGINSRNVFISGGSLFLSMFLSGVKVLLLIVSLPAMMLYVALRTLYRVLGSGGHR